MERPPSQLENMRPSGLKPPSRLPAMTGLGTTGRTLLETSSSDLNARNPLDGNGNMAPPVSIYKHKISNLPEPPTKRKTLAERAGEPVNPLRSHLPGVTKPSVTRSDSNSAQVGARGISTTVNGYRNTSNASTSSSTSSIRPGSRGNGFKHLRQQSVAEVPTEVEEDSETGVMGKRKGTPILSLKPANTDKIALRKIRTHSDLRQQYTTGSRVQQPGFYHISEHGEVFGYDRDASSRKSSLSLQQPPGPRQVSRNISLSTAFAELSLTPPQHYRKRSETCRKTSLEDIREDASPSKIPKFSCTPSLRHVQSSQALLQTPTPSRHKGSVNGLRTPAASVKRKHELPIFLTKEKLTPVAAWDTKGRLEDMEQLYSHLRSQFALAADSKNALEESLALYKSQVQDFKQANKDLTSTNRTVTADLERARNDLHTTTTDLRQARRDHEREIQDLERRHEKEINDVQSKHERELAKLEKEGERAVSSLESEIKQAKESMEKQKRDEIADLTSQHWEELDEAKSRHQKEVAKLEAEIAELRRSDQGRAEESATQVQALRDSLASVQAQLEAGNAALNSLRAQITSADSKAATLEQEKAALVSKTHFLEGNQEAQSHEFTTMSEKLADAVAAREATIETLRKEEMLRRKLNAQILELRGNIRVFVRTRPLLGGEDDPAKVEYTDADTLDGKKEMVVHAPTTFSATGKERNEKHSYAFDRIFTPGTANRTVFEDCQELVQSVVDGYNVSILSYGQTGSGKTFGMSGVDGIIPSSIGLLLSEIQRLKEKGWDYTVEANFVEVYNEMLNDLLGDAKTWDNDDDMNTSARGKKKEKHEIHHDSLTGKTTVSNLTATTLWPPPSDDASWPPAPSSVPPTGPNATAADAAAYTEKAVNNLLDTAAKNRRVAATKANERSSRSHSIFMLTLKGSCAATGESSEGVLNLVDLAGSERLKQSGAEGNRMKETQAINKSLSSLGDVIAALGSSKGGSDAHVPYRNSKLTYLLQSSLGGTAANGKSSRTLMLLHLSPRMEHWQESRGSLLFGSKVHGTHIGAAKKK